MHLLIAISNVNCMFIFFHQQAAEAYVPYVPVKLRRGGAAAQQAAESKVKAALEHDAKAARR